jgi:hypothetical protein
MVAPRCALWLRSSVWLLLSVLLMPGLANRAWAVAACAHAAPWLVQHNQVHATEAAVLEGVRYTVMYVSAVSLVPPSTVHGVVVVWRGQGEQLH